jgi:hypothetical protein
MVFTRFGYWGRHNCACCGLERRKWGSKKQWTIQLVLVVKVALRDVVFPWIRIVFIYRNNELWIYRNYTPDCCVCILGFAYIKLHAFHLHQHARLNMTPGTGMKLQQRSPLQVLLSREAWTDTTPLTADVLCIGPPTQSATIDSFANCSEKIYRYLIEYLTKSSSEPNSCSANQRNFILRNPKFIVMFKRASHWSLSCDSQYPPSLPH